MPDNMNLDYLKLLYHQYYYFKSTMTMSVVGGHTKKHANPSYKAKKHMKCTFLISDYH